jgi:hypothetical protein
MSLLVRKNTTALANIALHTYHTTPRDSDDPSKRLPIQVLYIFSYHVRARVAAWCVARVTELLRAGPRPRAGARRGSLSLPESGRAEETYRAMYRADPHAHSQDTSSTRRTRSDPNAARRDGASHGLTGARTSICLDVGPNTTRHLLYSRSTTLWQQTVTPTSTTPARAIAHTSHRTTRVTSRRPSGNMPYSTYQGRTTLEQL